MNKSAFLEVLKTYDLPTETVYEDLSELGTTLWHNGRLAVKVVWEVGFQPSLLIVVLCAIDEYSYFGLDMEKLDSATIGRVVKYARDENDSLYNAALTADDQLRIPIDGEERIFDRR